jgi:hypothetical protein
MTYQQQETVIKAIINLHNLLLIIRPLFQDTTFILTSHVTFIPRPNIYIDLLPGLPGVEVFGIWARLPLRPFLICHKQ